MEKLKINHAAVWICVILLTALGFVWYGPLFGEQWMGLVGLDMATVEANPPTIGAWITNTIATVVPVYVLAWLFANLGIRTLVGGALTGFLIAFSFIFLTEMTTNLFSGRPYILTWITGGFNLTGLTLSGAILGAWTKTRN